MAFDWLSFLRRYNIAHTTSGPNTAKGNVSIRCPFCGPSDPSMHLGVSLSGKGWKCWRVREHRGKSNVRLIRALIGCSVEQAIALVGRDDHVPDDFMGPVNLMMREDSPSPLQMEIRLPEEFKRFDLTKPSFRPYLHYLTNRGFTPRQIETMTEKYDLRYCTRGPYAGRIIFPIYLDGVLMSWTGRSISRHEAVRYKTLTTKEDKGRAEGYGTALAPSSELLLWYDDLFQTRAYDLVVVEGPFDALKMNVLCRWYGVAATCLFTSAISDEQIDLLHRVSSRFEGRYILLDAEKYEESLHICYKLVTLGFRPLKLPEGLEDPGELSRQTIGEFLSCLS